MQSAVPSLGENIYITEELANTAPGGMGELYVGRDHEDFAV